MNMGWSHGWLTLHEQEEFDSGLTLIKCSRLSPECITEEMSRKGQMTKEKKYNGYKMVFILVCMDNDLKNHYALI